jgi:hypothetical protein
VTGIVFLVTLVALVVVVAGALMLHDRHERNRRRQAAGTLTLTGPVTVTGKFTVDTTKATAALADAARALSAVGMAASVSTASIQNLSTSWREQISRSRLDTAIARLGRETVHSQSEYRDLIASIIENHPSDPYPLLIAIRNTQTIPSIRKEAEQ